jgi:hypothetical protein
MLLVPSYYSFSIFRFLYCSSRAGMKRRESIHSLVYGMRQMNLRSTLPLFLN